MSAEEWRPVVGWEGRYEVSNLGRVRGLSTLSPRLIVQQVNVKRGGYPQVRLYAGPVRKKRCVHRLVLEAFVGPMPGGMVTRHLNGDPMDNRLANLRYGTQVENLADRLAHGTHPSLSTHCRNGHEYTPENTLQRPSSRGRRLCRQCDEAKESRRAARRQGVVA